MAMAFSNSIDDDFADGGESHSCEFPAGYPANHVLPNVEKDRFLRDPQQLTGTIWRFRAPTLLIVKVLHRVGSDFVAVEAASITGDRLPGLDSHKSGGVPAELWQERATILTNIKFRPDHPALWGKDCTFIGYATEAEVYAARFALDKASPVKAWESWCCLETKFTEPVRKPATTKETVMETAKKELDISFTKTPPRLPQIGDVIEIYPGSASMTPFVVAGHSRDSGHLVLRLPDDYKKGGPGTNYGWSVADAKVVRRATKEELEAVDLAGYQGDNSFHDVKARLSAQLLENGRLLAEAEEQPGRVEVAELRERLEQAQKANAAYSNDILTLRVELGHLQSCNGKQFDTINKLHEEIRLLKAAADYKDGTLQMLHAQLEAKSKIDATLTELQQRNDNQKFLIDSLRKELETERVDRHVEIKRLRDTWGHEEYRLRNLVSELEQRIRQAAERLEGI